jgi:DinB superfamily
MPDYQAVLNDTMTIDAFVAGLTIDDLRSLTHEMVDKMQDLIADCEDADVTFVPRDPEADDPFAEREEDVKLAWNLGHVIVHTTASAEESAALAAELARGVENHGRSRYETPWQSITTIKQCLQRLEESRRIRLASLEMWPDQPHLDNTYKPRDDVPHVNCMGRFILGLVHDDSHLEQIAGIVRQA